MTRTLYAGRPGDTVVSLFELGTGRIILGVPVDATGSPVGVTLTVWDEPDGTQLTDLLAADGVTPITAIEVPSGTIQIPAFYGPDGVDTDLYLKDPEGDYTRIDLGPPGPAGAPGGVTSVNGSTGVVVIPDASTTVEGIVELATSAETTTGTDTTRATTPAGVKAVADTKQPIDVDVSGLATTGTVTIDVSNGQGVYSSATLTGNVTLTPSNVPGSGPCIVEWRSTQHASAAKTITVSTKPMNQSSTTFTPAVGKKVSVFFEWVDGADLRIWASVES